MKKTKKALLIAGILACSVSALTGTASAATITIDSKQLTGNSVTSYVNQGVTMVPLRVISENLGCNVQFDKATKNITITKKGTTIELTLGKLQAKVNGSTQILIAKPEVKNNTTYVPIRFISENLGCTVSYNSKTGDVSIQSGGDTSGIPTTSNKDAFGRTKRTTNLPKNAQYFPYITQGVPNWCYEQQPWDDNYWGPFYIEDAPKGASKAGTLPTGVYASDSELQQVILDNWDMINDYVDACLNFDYRTTDLNTYLDTVCNNVRLISTIYKSKEEMKKDWMVTMKHAVEYKNITQAKYQILPETAWVPGVNTGSRLAFSVYVEDLYRADNPKENPRGGYAIWSGESATYTYNVGTKGVVPGTHLSGIMTFVMYKNKTTGKWEFNYSESSYLQQLIPHCDILNGVNPAKKDPNRIQTFDYTWTRDENIRYSRYDKNVKAGY